MRGLLKDYFEIINNSEEADLIILNVCSVKIPTVNKVIKKIKEIKEKYPYKKLVIAGCISKDMLPRIREITEDASLISTHNIGNIISIVEETMNDNPVEVLGYNNKIKLNQPKIRQNPVIGIIPISNGCNLTCSYCSVRFVKGKLISYPIGNIRKEVIQCLKHGCKEIWITSQDSASYMTEKEQISKLPDLINNISEINKEFFIRIGMMNPNNLKPILDEMINIYKNNNKIFKFLHLPLQSGNNEILKKMKRDYCIEDFKKIIKKFRKEIPEITISTDIICGFPTETKEQFMDSVNIIKEITPDVLNISRFWLRPGTEAEKLKQLPGGETKERSRLLNSAFEWIAFEQNKKWKNWVGKVLIDEKGKDNTFIGRNYTYKPIVVKSNDNLLGYFVDVRVNEITKYDLRGEII
jgi:MiaB-like tRNA modifying enzyme